jgi:hypothetical protein
MTGRVSRRRDNPHAAIPEHVMIALKFGDRVCWLEARSVVRGGPIVFGLAAAG